MFWLWASFLALITILLALDLGVFHRKDHVIKVKEAMWWSAFWISLGVAFSGLVYAMYHNHWFGIGLFTVDDAKTAAAYGVEIGTQVERLGGGEATIEYLSGYFIEKSLSIDNIFVIVIIFTRFRVPAELQHRVLFWGILGAIVFRGLMIGAGISALRSFEWMFYVFGGLLIFLAIKMLVSNDDDDDPSDTFFVRFITKLLPFSSKIEGHKFVLRENGKRVFSRLMLALLVIELSDILFAVDSIPAVFAVTQESFIVFSSNIFAILGLRSLYFALADLVHRFEYLKYSLVAILAFVGVKMCLLNLDKEFPDYNLHISTPISLGVILLCLTLGLVASLWATRGRDSEPRANPMTDQSFVNIGVRTPIAEDGEKSVDD